MRRRQSAVLRAIAIATIVIACGDYARTNPYDAAVDVQITISGPDTLFSFGELGHFSASTIPVFPDTAIEWGSADSSEFEPAGEATFRNAAPPLYPDVRTVAVRALIGHLDTVKTKVCVPYCPPVSVPDITWRHKASKFITLTQRITRVQLRCPNAHVCDTLAVGGAWSVWVDGFDALNRQVSALTSSTANPTTGLPIVLYSIRDTSIASLSPVGIRAATVNAQRAGATWIVGVRGSLSDSLRLVVR